LWLSYLDILVDDQLIVELKAVEQVSGIHQAQLLPHLKLSVITTGLPISFNIKVLKDGITRLKA